MTGIFINYTSFWSGKNQLVSCDSGQKSKLITPAFASCLALRPISHWSCPLEVADANNLIHVPLTATDLGPEHKHTSALCDPLLSPF